MTNLVDNAIKFTEPGGRVNLRLDPAWGQATLVVSDKGVGITSEHLPLISERFHQADPAGSSGGTGLGLSIGRRIAQAHGGSIRAESRPGGGCPSALVLPSAAEVIPSPDVGIGGRCAGRR